LFLDLKMSARKMGVKGEDERTMNKSGDLIGSPIFVAPWLARDLSARDRHFQGSKTIGRCGL